MKIGNYPPVIRSALNQRAQAAQAQPLLIRNFTDQESIVQRQDFLTIHSQKCGGGRRIIRRQIGGE